MVNNLEQLKKGTKMMEKIDREQEEEIKMKVVKIKKLVGLDEIQDICEFVFGVDSKATLKRWYESGHSPIYTQWFSLYTEIPKSVFEQLRTHEKNGCQFFVQSGRPDTGTTTGNSRDSIRRVVILCNAQHLINMSHKRLCTKAEKPTREFMKLLKSELYNIDEGLAEMLVPICEYRNGICKEFNCCGINRKFKGTK